MTRPILYLSGPYSAGNGRTVAENIAVARAHAVSAARKGWHPFTPVRFAFIFPELPQRFDLATVVAALRRHRLCHALAPSNRYPRIRSDADASASPRRSPHDRHRSTSAVRCCRRASTRLAATQTASICASVRMIISGIPSIATR